MIKFIFICGPFEEGCTLNHTPEQNRSSQIAQHHHNVAELHKAIARFMTHANRSEPRRHIRRRFRRIPVWAVHTPELLIVYMITVFMDELGRIYVTDHQGMRGRRQVSVEHLHPKIIHAVTTALNVNLDMDKARS